jgi:hypothetical protein
MTVTRFCEAEGVSAPSFYAWRRKLNSGAAGGAGKSRPTFQPVVIGPAALLAPGLRVRLASGAEIEVGAGHLDVIRAVVGELARIECAFAAGEEASC